MTAIEQAVIQVLAKELRLRIDMVTLDSNLLTDLGVDSLDAVEIVLALEEHFKTELPESTHETIKTVQDIVNTIAAHTEH